MHLYHILDAMSKGRRWPKFATCNFTSSLRGCVDYFQEGWTPTCEGWSIIGTSQATDLRYEHIFYTYFTSIVIKHLHMVIFDNITFPFLSRVFRGSRKSPSQPPSHKNMNTQFYMLV